MPRSRRWPGVREHGGVPLGIRFVGWEGMWGPDFASGQLEKESSLIGTLAVSLPLNIKLEQKKSSFSALA